MAAGRSVEESVVPALAQVRDALQRDGLLLAADAVFPSVSAIVAGEPIRGSWWAHSRGKTIFAVLDALEDAGDTLFAKLLNGKVTLVHRRWWGPVVTVARARRAWQTRDLGPAARALLRTVDRERHLRLDALRGTPAQVRANAAAAVDLERRLLVHGAQVHTESGAHARVLQTWERWARSVRFRPRGRDVARASDRLRRQIEALNSRSGARVRLPWQR